MNSGTVPNVSNLASRLFEGVLTYLCVCVIIVYYSVSAASSAAPEEQYRLIHLLGYRTYNQVAGGAYYGIITNTLFHINLLHLSFNILTLLLTGLLIEKHYGKVKFCMIWLLGAVLPVSYYYIVFHNHGVGISGVIYTFWGILLSAQFLQKRMRISIFIHVILAAGFVTCFCLTAMKIMNIANSVHVASIILGAAVSFLINPAKDDCAR